MNRLTSLAFAAGMMASGMTQATVIFDYDTVATGALPVSDASWLTATITNDGSGVKIDLDVSLETTGEFIGDVFFNLDTSFDNKSVLAAGNGVEWTYWSNHYTGGTGVKFDLDAADLINGSHVMNGVQTFSILLANLQESNFVASDGWWTMAHVQGIGEDGCSGWIGDSVVSRANNVTGHGDENCGAPNEVPEPGTLGLLGLGLAGLGIARRKQAV